MTTIQAFIKRRPVLSYFALTFAISWGGILIALAPVGFPISTEQGEFYLALMVNQAGPLLSGILLTSLIYGRAGLREFLSRLLRWRVGARWYAVALLTAPLLAAATLFALSLISPVFLPGIFATNDKVSLLLLGLVVGILGGLEEPGWTGFAVPELRRRYSILVTALIVGFLWGAWHFLLTYWASGDASGAFSLSRFAPALVFYVAVLPTFRVLMVWVYDRTESLLVAMLMHASLTASVTMIFMPLAASGAALSTWYLVLTAVLWLVVAAVAVANGGHLSRPGKPPAGVGSPQLTPG
ncbi:MAG: CPBP family intramembrane metalloprotease [Caldilineaceae bacterium]|nr:CPBP family intramembrane metalloprotease [Caldilineaceae bacterium]